MTLAEFIHAELERYEPDGGRPLYEAAARAIRFEQYIAEIVRRYTEAGRLHSQMIQDAMASPSEPALIASVNQQTVLVHLEIESFYVFAKMFLYRVARLLHWSFATARFARGISINKHHELIANLPRLLAAGDLRAPDDMLTLAQELQTRIVDYRDKEVEHDDRHTIAMTYFRPDLRTCRAPCSTRW